MNQRPPLNRDQARNYALRLLNQRHYSVASLRQKLKQRQVSDTDAEAILTYLLDLKLLDDTAYAEAVARTESQYRHASKRRIEQKLRQKGIAPPTIENTLKDLDPENEQAAVAHHAKRYLHRKPTPLTYATRQQLAGYLYRKGFSSSVIQQFLSQLGRAGE